MSFYPAPAHQHGSTMYSSATADCTGSRQQAAASKCGEIGSAAFSVVTGPPPDLLSGIDWHEHVYCSLRLPR